MMFKCNIGVLPLPVSALFQYNSVIHAHNTRRSKFIHTPINLSARILHRASPTPRLQVDQIF